MAWREAGGRREGDGEDVKEWRCEVSKRWGWGLGWGRWGERGGKGLVKIVLKWLRHLGTS